MKPTTLEESLSMVPTHWPLMPGMDLYKANDEFRAYDSVWRKIPPIRVGAAIESGDFYYGDIRRLIPQDVRESAAWWLLYNTLAEVVPASRELGVTFYIAVDALGREKLIVTREHADLNTRRFTDRLAANDATLILGGEQRIIKELSAGPDPLGRWILAGKP